MTQQWNLRCESHLNFVPSQTLEVTFVHILKQLIFYSLAKRDNDSSIICLNRYVTFIMQLPILLIENRTFSSSKTRQLHQLLCMSHVCDLHEKICLSGVKFQGKVSETKATNRTYDHTVELMFYHVNIKYKAHQWPSTFILWALLGCKHLQCWDKEHILQQSLSIREKRQLWFYTWQSFS